MLIRYPSNLATVIVWASIFVLSACSSGSSSSNANPPAKTEEPGPAMALPKEPSPDCHLNIDERLAAGEGYCYETSMLSHDGTLIAMQVFVPQPEKMKALASLGDATDPGYAPLIIHSHGFGGNKAEDFSPPGTEIDRQISLDLWQSAYWVISFTQRGFGGIDGNELASGGQIGLMSPDKEGWDFVRLVDWAICHLRENAPLEAATAEENNDPEYDECGQGANSQWGRSLLASDAGLRLSSFDDNIALGTIGYSYGGGFQFNAQSVDPRVDAILPMGTWYDLRTSLHPNDTPKTAWIAIMTAFSSSTPGVGGGNGQALPDIIVDANSEANGANNEVDDVPYNKPHQVSVKNMNILAPNGPVAYCDNHALTYGIKYQDPDTEVYALNGTNKPAHAASQRLARADLFMIQGYGDTLFPMDEGFDNARCFEKAGMDVYYLGETSGHPLPAVGPANYAGIDTGMYLDEIVHCGVDSNGVPQRYNTRLLGRQWFDSKLRNAGDFTAALPHKVCITQPNADTALTLDTSDDYFDNGTTNDSVNAYKWSREGAVFDTVADVPVGGTAFALEASTLSTGTGSAGQDPNSDPRIIFVPLTTMDSSQVIAGMPSANLLISRQNPLNDEIFFAGIAVKRCMSRPTPLQSASECEDNPPELLHFQVMPIRLFATDALGVTEQGYPADDPRNFSGETKGHYYGVRWGDNPPMPTKGRLRGVTARLYPGDVVGLQLMPEHPAYTSIFSPTPGQVTVSGIIELPFFTAPQAAPVNIPDYVLEN